MRIWKATEKKVKLKDERDFLIQLCWETLHTAGWEDNPKDQTRTMSNMEASAIEYVDERYPHMDNWPIYVEDENNPDCMVGIEQVFDIVVLYGDGKQIRYIGTIDGLVWEMPMGELCWMKTRQRRVSAMVGSSHSTCRIRSVVTAPRVVLYFQRSGLLIAAGLQA